MLWEFYLQLGDFFDELPNILRVDCVALLRQAHSLHLAPVLLQQIDIVDAYW